MELILQIEEKGEEAEGGGAHRRRRRLQVEELDVDGELPSEHGVDRPHEVIAGLELPVTDL